MSRRLWTDRYSVRFSCSPAGIFISNYFWEFHILYGESSSKKLWKSERMITTRLNWVWEYFFFALWKILISFSSLCRICSEWWRKVVESRGIRKTHVLGILQFSLFFPPHSRVLAHMRNDSWALELSFSTNIAIFVRKKGEAQQSSTAGCHRLSSQYVSSWNLLTPQPHTHGAQVRTRLSSEKTISTIFTFSLSPMAKSVALRGFRVELRKFINISQTPAHSSLFYALCARRSGRRGRWRWLSELDNSELLIWRQCP